MQNKKYLVLVHWASKGSRNNLEHVARHLNDALKMNLSGTVTVLTSIAAVAVMGMSSKTAAQLFSEIAPCLYTGDNLSVMELGDDIATSHPGC